MGRVQRAWSKRPRVMLSLCSRSDSQTLSKSFQKKMVRTKVVKESGKEMIMSQGGLKLVTWQMACYAPINWATKSFENSMPKFKYGWGARNQAAVGYPSCHAFRRIHFYTSLVGTGNIMHEDHAYSFVRGLLAWCSILIFTLNKMYPCTLVSLRNETTSDYDNHGIPRIANI